VPHKVGVTGEAGDLTCRVDANGHGAQACASACAGSIERDDFVLWSVRCGSYAGEDQNTGQYSQHRFASFHKLFPLFIHWFGSPFIQVLVDPEKPRIAAAILNSGK
jgi:hypothetical protein